MSFVGIKIPHETARLLSQIAVPGSPVPLDQMHITVCYLGENISITQIAKAVAAIYKVTSKRTPFTLKTSKVKCFPTATDIGVPVIARVNSPELLEFQQCITAGFDKCGIHYDKRYPDFKPHITLSYAEDQIDCITFEHPIEWAAHEATLWAGDWGDDRLSATFPFILGPTKESYYRHVIKQHKK
jgi:2'-5' RNA ligase